MPFPKPTKKVKVSKVDEWYKVMHSEIIPQFQRWGITTCEIKLSVHCRLTNYLTFAHTKKRRKITTPEDLRRVVLACQPCHEVVEYSCIDVTGKTMQEYLDEIIENREERLRILGIL